MSDLQSFNINARVQSQNSMGARGKWKHSGSKENEESRGSTPKSGVHWVHLAGMMRGAGWSFRDQPMIEQMYKLKKEN